MRQRILRRTLQVCLRSLLTVLSFTVLTSRGMRFFILHTASFLKSVVQFIAPAFLFTYLKFRQWRVRAIRFLNPLRGQAFYLLGHRYFIHSLVIALVLFASVPSLFAADISPSAIGGELPLNRLIVEDEKEEIIIDDTLPAEELESYLEGRFQDQPPTEPREQSMPLTLDGEALLRPDLPGTTVPLTRTEIVEYEVQPGDTLWAVAEDFGVSVATVLWENKLTLYSTIRPGQKLTILPISGTSHIVKKGDTLGSIVKRYGASLDEIKEINKIADAGSALTLGTKLVIPGGRPYVAPQPTRTAQRREVVVPPSIAATPGGKFLWPAVSKRITQYFTWRHAAVDIGDKTGSPIYAAESGVVEVAGWGRGGWGNTVVVNHGNGLKTRYSHASKVLVAPGEQITKGQVIALIGSTGRSTGPHVDFRIYVNGRTVNPLKYLR